MKQVFSHKNYISIIFKKKTFIFKFEPYNWHGNGQTAFIIIIITYFPCHKLFANVFYRTKNIYHRKKLLSNTAKSRRYSVSLVFHFLLLNIFNHNYSTCVHTNFGPLETGRSCSITFIRKYSSKFYIVSVIAQKAKMKFCKITYDK